MASQRISSLSSTGDPSHPASLSSSRTYPAESAEGQNVYLPPCASSSSLPVHPSPPKNLLLLSTRAPSIGASLARFPSTRAPPTRAPSTCAPSLPSSLSSPPSLGASVLHPLEPAFHVKPQHSTARVPAAVLPSPQSTSIRQDSHSSRTPRSYSVDPAPTSAVDDLPDVVTSPDSRGPFLTTPSSEARHEHQATSDPSVLLPSSFEFWAPELRRLCLPCQPRYDSLSKVAWDIHSLDILSIPLMRLIEDCGMEKVVKALQQMESGHSTDPTISVLVKYFTFFRIIAATQDSINEGLTNLWAPFSAGRSEATRATFVENVERDIRHLVAVCNSLPKDLDDVGALAKVFAGIRKAVRLTEAICFVIVLALQSEIAQGIISEERAGAGSLLLAVFIVCKVLYQLFSNDPKASPEAYKLAREGISGMRECGLELLLWRIELSARVRLATPHEGATSLNAFQLAYDHHHRTGYPSSGLFAAVARNGAGMIRPTHCLDLCPLSTEQYQALAVEPNFFTPYETVYYKSSGSWMGVVLKCLKRLGNRRAQSPP